MHAFEVHENEEYCNFGDLDLPDLFCLIDEIVKMCHSCIKDSGAVVEMDLHHPLNELDLGKDHCAFCDKFAGCCRLLPMCHNV